MKQCPRCGCHNFYVTAHVVQGWVVDGFGDHVLTSEECVEVSHYPDDDDLWTCKSCHYEDMGAAFNV